MGRLSGRSGPSLLEWRMGPDSVSRRRGCGSHPADLWIANLSPDEDLPKADYGRSREHLGILSTNPEPSFHRTSFRRIPRRGWQPLGSLRSPRRPRAHFHGRNVGSELKQQAMRDCATILLGRLGRRLTSLRENNVWVTYYSPGIW